ncbi:hypothetical protein DIPPA_23902 [Diplonema papillatum]|nr:hypothetical protein DIPPA_23902 [Diplonema papillatum]
MRGLLASCFIVCISLAGRAAGGVLPDTQAENGPSPAEGASAGAAGFAPARTRGLGSRSVSEDSQRVPARNAPAESSSRGDPSAAEGVVPRTPAGERVFGRSTAVDKETSRVPARGAPDAAAESSSRGGSHAAEGVVPRTPAGKRVLGRSTAVDEKVPRVPAGKVPDVTAESSSRSGSYATEGVVPRTPAGERVVGRSTAVDEKVTGATAASTSGRRARVLEAPEEDAGSDEDDPPAVGNATEQQGISNTMEYTADVIAIGQVLMQSGSAVSLARLVLVARRCGATRVARPLHPLQFTIEGSVALGVVIGNGTLLLSVFAAYSVVIFIAAAVAHQVVPLASRKLDVQGAFRFPSLPMGLVLLQYQGLSHAAFILLYYPVHAAGCLFGGVCLLVCAVYPLWTADMVTMGTSRQSDGLKAMYQLADEGNTKPDTRVTLFLWGPGEWLNLRKNVRWVRRYASLFADYRPQVAWWLTVDLVAGLLVSAIAALPTGNMVSCGHANAGNAVVVLLLMLLTFVRAPHAKARDNWAAIAQQLLEVLGLAFGAIGAYAAEHIAWCENLAEAFFLCSALVLAVKLLLDVITEIAVHFTRRRKYLQDSAWVGDEAGEDGISLQIDDAPASDHRSMPAEQQQSFDRSSGSGECFVATLWKPDHVNSPGFSTSPLLSPVSLAVSPPTLSLDPGLSFSAAPTPRPHPRNRSSTLSSRNRSSKDSRARSLDASLPTDPTLLFPLFTTSPPPADRHRLSADGLSASGRLSAEFVRLDSDHV